MGGDETEGNWAFFQFLMLNSPDELKRTGVNSAEIVPERRSWGESLTCCKKKDKEGKREPYIHKSDSSIWNMLSCSICLSHLHERPKAALLRILPNRIQTAVLLNCVNPLSTLQEAAWIRDSSDFQCRVLFIYLFILVCLLILFFALFFGFPSGVFALLQAYAFLQYLKDRLTRQEFQTLFFLGVSIAAGLVFLTVIYLTYTGLSALVFWKTML